MNEGYINSDILNNTEINENNIEVEENPNLLNKYNIDKYNPYNKKLRGESQEFDYTISIKKISKYDSVVSNKPISLNLFKKLITVG